MSVQAVSSRNHDPDWWTLDTVKGPSADINTAGKLSQRLLQTVQDIEARQVTIFENFRKHARLYCGYLPAGLNWGTNPTVAQRQSFQATKGIVRSICDTATALISRFRPKPTFVTDNGDWKVQHQAEDLDQFMVGAYKRGGLYGTAQRCFHDSTWSGTGLWKLVPRGEGESFYISYDRVLPDDMVVDEEECRDGLIPLNMYHRTPVKIEKLIAKYCPGKSQRDIEIQNRLRANDGRYGWPSRHVGKGMALMVDATHVDPDGECRRTVVVDGIVLEDGPWPFDFHPYEVLWWAPPISGWYGDGVAYRQFGRQERITYLHRWIQRVHDLYSTPRAWVDPAGGPPTLQLSNELGAVISCRKPPTIVTQQSVPAEIYKWLDELEQGGFQDEGISQVSAANILPPGLESAPAQREYSFKEGQRFAPVSQRWEDSVAVSNAKKTVAMYRHYVKDLGATPTVKWADRNMLHTIEWPDLDEDVYQIHAEASSLDALSPSSRLQAAIELSQTGWLDKGEGRQLLGHPDLERSYKLDNAPRAYAEWVLRQLNRGKRVQVDEKADLALLDSVVRKGRLLAVMSRGVPPAVMEALDSYLEELDAAMQAAAAAMQVMAGPAGAPGVSGPLSTPAAQGMPAPFSPHMPAQPNG